MLYRRDLLDAVWGDQEVGDVALTVVISRLRHHFERLGMGEDVIQTVPKSGYRFVGFVPADVDVRRDELGNRAIRRLAWTALALGAAALPVALAALAPHLGVPI